MSAWEKILKREVKGTCDAILVTVELLCDCEAVSIVNLDCMLRRRARDEVCKRRRCSCHEKYIDILAMITGKKTFISIGTQN